MNYRSLIFKQGLVANLVLILGPTFALDHCTAQEASTRKWRTVDGGTAEATFGSLDEEANQITLLFPKVIPFERLDKSSRDAARRLSLEPTTKQLLSQREELNRQLALLNDEIQKLRDQGKSLTDEISTLRNRYRPLEERRAKFGTSIEYLNTSDDVSPLIDARPAAIAELAYLRSGSEELSDSNSLPIMCKGPCLYVCVVGKVTGESAFASISVDGAAKGETFIGDSLGLHDTPPGKTRCLIKLSYREDAGEAFCNVATQQCTWTVALFNLDRVPTPSEIDETAKSVLAFGGWPLDTEIEK